MLQKEVHQIKRMKSKNCGSYLLRLKLFPLNEKAMQAFDESKPHTTFPIFIIPITFLFSVPR